MNRHPPRRVLALLLIGASMSSTMPADAQTAAPADAAVAEARQRFLRGVKLYEEDDFRAALIEFNRAYQTAPNPAVLYNITQAYYQLRDYANALRTLERYVQQTGDRMDEERRSRVTRELEELRGRVAHVTFASNVANVEVVLDDARLGQTPLQGPQLVSAGRHELIASKSGYVTLKKTVDIAGGDVLTVDLNLTEAPHPSTADAATAPRGAPVAALVTLGVGVAGLVVGTVAGVEAIHDKSLLDGVCEGKICPPSARPQMSAFSRDGAVSTVAFGVGAAGVATGVILYLVSRGGERHEPGPAVGGEVRAQVYPWVSPGAAGLAGTF